MRYLLDTNTVSDFFRQHPGVLIHFGQVAPAELTINSVTVMETEYGLARQPAALRCGRTSAYSVFKKRLQDFVLAVS